MSLSIKPDLLYRHGAFTANTTLHIDNAGYIAKSEALNATPISMPGKALLPGFINVHSHSFQRLIRGRAESRAVSGKDFWSWRGTMYHAAASLTPEDVYDVARMAFLEMVKAGTTTVGEFHYLHNAPNGQPYDDPNLLSKQVIAAAQSVGIRIVLLRSAYLRSGYQTPSDPGQKRFFENATNFVTNTESLIASLPSNSNEVKIGIAPHSIRAVPLADLRDIITWARQRALPIHMHIAEQLRENAECEQEHGLTPVAMLAREGLLGPDLTAVHAIHISEQEIAQLAASGATICSCPTTERNLGDGILAADIAMQAGIPIALGSDSQAQIDPLEDARQLDYHLRLAQQQRAILDQIDGQSIALRLFECATINGAHSLHLNSGDLSEGNYADFITIDRNDLSIAGNSAVDLLPTIVFGMGRTAVRDVAVNGRLILRGGHHALEEEIIERYKLVHARVWS